MSLIPLILAAAAAPQPAEDPEPPRRPAVLLAQAAAPKPPRPVYAPPPPPRIYAPAAPPPPPPPPPMRLDGPRPPVQRSGTITGDDYPAAAIRSNEEGSATIQMEVGPHGGVERCTVTRSSGSAILDHASCVLATRRFRYSPAIDARGRPVRGQATRTITWRLPDDPLPPLNFVNGWVLVAVPRIGPESALANCVEVASSPMLTQLATDLCHELLPDAGPAAGPRRPARRARLVISGALGEPPPRPPAERGRVVYCEQAQFRIGPDGTVTDCRPGAVVNLWGEASFDLCRFLATTDGPFFAPVSPPQTGRMALEVYE